MRSAAAVLLSAFLGAGAAAAADDLRIELDNAPGALRLLVVNTADHGVMVNTRLAYGPDVPLWEISLDVRDAQGRTKPFTSLPQIGPPQDSDWRYLPGHKIVGTEISLDRIGADYALDAGTYEAIASYRLVGKDGTVLKLYRSNKLRFAIEGDLKQHVERMEAGGLKLDLSQRKKPAAKDPAHPGE